MWWCLCDVFWDFFIQWQKCFVFLWMYITLNAALFLINFSYFEFYSVFLCEFSSHSFYSNIKQIAENVWIQNAKHRECTSLFEEWRSRQAGTWRHSCVSTPRTLAHASRLESIRSRARFSVLIHSYLGGFFSCPWWTSCLWHLWDFTHCREKVLWTIQRQQVFKVMCNLWLVVGKPFNLYRNTFAEMISLILAICWTSSVALQHMFIRTHSY